ncbi:MAG: Crp/Fnr family transcriptional regulator [Pseudomonadota bacterium]
MVSIEDLRKMYLLKGLEDQVLEKISPITQLRQFKENEVIYEEGQAADNLYFLKRGKVLQEVEVSEVMIISLGSIKPGYTFGWSALLGGTSYTTYAVCAELSEVLIMPGDRFHNLLDEDHAMGYIVMENLAKILKNRLERRVEQFLRVMSKHPDIQKLLGL